MTTLRSRQRGLTLRPLLHPALASFACLLASTALFSANTFGQGGNGGRSTTKFYTDFSDTADALLRNAAGHEREKQWSEAIEIYQRVIQQYGDKVAKLPPDQPAGVEGSDFILYVDVRQFCQKRLAGLPPEARRLYREKVDSQAERWYRQGAKDRDRVLLRRVVDQAFASSWGDDAADLLGDLAFQDGRFEEALAAYRQLVPDRIADGAGLVYPDPTVDIPRVAAKKLLARAALGENTPGPVDLEAYAKAYPNASGSLAAREGPYLATLATALKLDQLAPPSQPDGRWPTFAGSPKRTRIVPGPIDVGSKQWTVELERVQTGRGHRGNRGMPLMSGPARADRLLAYHPIVMGDQVIICNDSQIIAYNLNDRPDGRPSPSGASLKEAWKQGDEQAGAPQATRLSEGIPRFTLTAFGDRVYARMGLTSSPFMGGRMRGMNGGSQNYIMALDRSTDGKLLWKKPSPDVFPPRKPGDANNRNLGFEGSPVADARNVYVALTERREQTATYVACLDADTGATRWLRYLGAATIDPDNMFPMNMGMGMPGGGVPNDFGHRLLTLDGPTLYYQTNLGAVVALDAESGSVRWAATYPRVDRTGGSGHERDLNPAIIHDGLVIVAPDDASSIYAFEAAGGRLVWKTDPLPDEIKLAHLLGVAKGRLVATGDRVLLFDIKNGKLLHSWPDTGQGYEGFGRGILSGDKIYWPTRNEIHILDQTTALRSEPPIKLQETYQETGGNLAVGDGYLIVAQDNKLVVFCQNRRLIQRYREEIARAPDQAAPYYRLARAAEATGQDELALQSLDDAVKHAKDTETIDGEPLIAATRDHRYRLLTKIGEKARVAGDFLAAEQRYRQAAAAAPLDRDRLNARLAEADVQRQRGAVKESIETLQALLAEAPLRSIDIAIDHGRRTIRSDLLITDRLSSLVQGEGRPQYASFDREARALLDKGRADRNPRLLEEVGRSYPVAEAVPDALIALGKLELDRQRPAEAARAYKRLLAGPAGEHSRPRALALLGLARAYEAQKLWVPARDAYVQALNRFPEVSVELEELGTETRLAQVVSRKLQQPPFDRLTADRAEPSLPAPLSRLWSKTLGTPNLPLPADGIPPSSEASRIFLVQGKTLKQVNTSTGSPRWTADLGSTPVWVGYLDDRVVAGTETRLVALGLEKGNLLWQFDANDAAADGQTLNPFAPSLPASRPSAIPAGKLHGFRVVGNRVFCLRGEHQLLAFDGETNLIEWSFSAGAGAINPNLLIDPQRVVLQIRKPNALLVLETSSGRRTAEYPQDQEELWTRPPLPLDDDHVVLVADRRTVTSFDLAKGVNTWVFRETREMPKNGPPRVFGDAERLLLVQDGSELIRLDATSGLKKWARPLGAEDLSERPDALVLDGRRVYWVSGPLLSSVSLADGALAWRKHLSGPNSGWSVELTESSVLAYPGLPRKADSQVDGFPLVFLRRDDGRLVQRLLFSVPVTEVAVRLAPGGLVVATQAGLWALGERKPMDGPQAGR